MQLNDESLKVETLSKHKSHCERKKKNKTSTIFHRSRG